MTYWRVRIAHHGTAYIWQRKYFMGLIAIPWRYHGGTDIIMTQDKHDDVLKAALDYIFNKDPDSAIFLTKE